MSKSIGILGAGAVGSYIGGFLTREGYDVTLIDMWGAHVDAMNESGLNVSGTQGDFNVAVNAVHLADAYQLRKKFDYAFLALKSYDTEWGAHFLKRFLAPSGAIVSSQNCMNDRLIASIVGHEREIPCVMSGITVALWEPGHVTRGGQPGRDRGHDVFRIGEHHGQVTPRVEELVAMVSCIDGARATTNIWGERWSKLTTNASGNPMQGMTGLGSSGLSEMPGARRIQVQICKESAQVGLAHNVLVESISGVAAEVWARADEGDVMEDLDAKFRGGRGGSDWKSSMGQDVAKGRKTEVEFMNGFISRMGREIGVPTPVNDAVVSVVKQIDDGVAVSDPSNVDRVLELAGL
jgi:2-dehydropantoate 2-reductase